MEFGQAQWTLVAGLLLLGWVLARRTVVRRRNAYRDSQASQHALHQLRRSESSAVPLRDAPVETQRWQVALFDLQRELKADLDTRIAVVQSLIRQVDQRIEHLSRLQSGEAAEAPSGSPVEPGRIAALADRGHTAAEIAEQLGRPAGEIETALAAKDRGHA